MCVGQGALEVGREIGRLFTALLSGMACSSGGLAVVACIAWFAGMFMQNPLCACVDLCLLID